MRQAGRYLPEYRASRAKAGSFLAMAKNPELACEVTLQPLARFELDAAILFSDILTVPDAMGLGLYFVDGEGPKFERPLRDAASIAKPGPDMETESLRDGAVLYPPRSSRRGPLIGFSGSRGRACNGGAAEQGRARIKARPTTTRRRCTPAGGQYRRGDRLLRRSARRTRREGFDTWGGVLSQRCTANSRALLERIARERSAAKRRAYAVIVVARQPPTSAAGRSGAEGGASTAHRLGDRARTGGRSR